jgi:hypothetical protein
LDRSMFCRRSFATLWMLTMNHPCPVWMRARLTSRPVNHCATGHAILKRGDDDAVSLYYGSPQQGHSLGVCARPTEHRHRQDHHIRTYLIWVLIRQCLGFWSDALMFARIVSEEGTHERIDHPAVVGLVDRERTRRTQYQTQQATAEVRISAPPARER